MDNRGSLESRQWRGDRDRELFAILQTVCRDSYAIGFEIVGVKQLKSSGLASRRTFFSVKISHGGYAVAHFM